MQAVGTILVLLGALLGLVGTCWWLAECFMTHKIWGWAAILTFPLANVVWLCFYPRRGWKPTLVFTVGCLMAYGGYEMLGTVVSNIR